MAAHIIAYGGYAGDKLRQALSKIERWTVKIVIRSPAWLSRNRRLAKDFEQTIASTTASHLIASVQLLTRCIARL